MKSTKNEFDTDWKEQTRLLDKSVKEENFYGPDKHFTFGKKTKQLRSPLIMYDLISKWLIGLILKFGRKYVSAKKLNKDIRKVNGNRKSTMYHVDIVNSRMYMLLFLFCWGYMILTHAEILNMIVIEFTLRSSLYYLFIFMTVAC